MVIKGMEGILPASVKVLLRQWQLKNCARKQAESYFSLSQFPLAYACGS
jgi:hypothetical protein